MQGNEKALSVFAVLTGPLQTQEVSPMSTTQAYSTTSDQAIVPDLDAGDQVMYLNGNLVGFAGTSAASTEATHMRTTQAMRIRDIATTR